MNDKLDVLHVMHAIALYEKQGIIASVRYLVSSGYTMEEAIDILALYDAYVLQALKG